MTRPAAGGVRRVVARDLKNVYVYWFNDRVFLCHPCRCPHRKTTFLSCAWRAISSLPYLTYLRLPGGAGAAIYASGVFFRRYGLRRCTIRLRGTVVPRNCPYLAPYTKNGRKCGYLVHQANNAAAGSITGISHVRKTGKTFQVDHFGSFRNISKHCGSA